MAGEVIFKIKDQRYSIYLIINYKVKNMTNKHNI